MSQSEKSIPQLLKPHRHAIDKLDREIIDLLRKRYDIIDAVSLIKKKHNIPALLQDRVNEVRENAANYANELKLDTNFIRSLWAQIIQHSCETEDINFKK